MLSSYKVNKRIQEEILNEKKMSHSTSYPVVIRENGKYYLAVFVFFYSREDIEGGVVPRPTVWAIADIETGEITEERKTINQDFSDASYEIKYNIRSDRKYDTSKEYYENAFFILDVCRQNILNNKDFDKNQYMDYLQLIVANTPIEYQRFYFDLSI